jgi:hypothetical protein
VHPWTYKSRSKAASDCRPRDVYVLWARRGLLSCSLIPWNRTTLPDACNLDYIISDKQAQIMFKAIGRDRACCVGSLNFWTTSSFRIEEIRVYNANAMSLVTSDKKQ